MAEARRAFGGGADRKGFEPVLVNRPGRHAGAIIKVIAFNARWGLRLNEIIDRLRQPPLSGAGLILLSEVDLNVWRSKHRNVGSEIAKALEMSLLYVPEFAPKGQAGNPITFLGNAILSSNPIGEVRTIVLPNLRPVRMVKRMMGSPQGVAAAIDFGGRTITAGMAHLHSRTAPPGRDLQMARYLEGFPAGPAIIGGDFNTTTMELSGVRAMTIAAMRLVFTPRRFRMPMRYEPLFVRLAEAGFRIKGANVMGEPTFTFSGAIPRWARPKLDWIALRELEPVKGSAAVVAAKMGRFRRRISDHDFVTCEVRLEG